LTGAVIALLTLGAVPADAQFDRGQIAGVVRDQQGGVIPGATVTAMHLGRRISTTVVTNETGYYIFANLQPGAYDVSAELEGFKKAVTAGVQLDAGAKVSLDVTLQPGTITEAVTVTAEATPLQSDPAVRKTIEAKDTRCCPSPAATRSASPP
jgi:hypothetical protein